ncbi:MAG: hypothetical protein ACOX2N_04630 [Peptococcia bacterium]|jgi:hypothetical protein
MRENHWLRKEQVKRRRRQKLTLAAQKAQWIAQYYMIIPPVMMLRKKVKPIAILYDRIPSLPKDIYEAQAQLNQTDEQLRETNRRLKERYDLIPGVKMISDFMSPQVDKLQRMANITITQVFVQADELQLMADRTVSRVIVTEGMLQKAENKLQRLCEKLNKEPRGYDESAYKFSSNKYNLICDIDYDHHKEKLYSNEMRMIEDGFNKLAKELDFVLEKCPQFRDEFFTTKQKAEERAGIYDVLRKAYNDRDLGVKDPDYEPHFLDYEPYLDRLRELEKDLHNDWGLNDLDGIERKIQSQIRFWENWHYDKLNAESIVKGHLGRICKEVNAAPRNKQLIFNEFSWLERRIDNTGIKVRSDVMEKIDKTRKKIRERADLYLALDKVDDGRGSGVDSDYKPIIDRLRELEKDLHNDWGLKNLDRLERDVESDVRFRDNEAKRPLEEWGQADKTTKGIKEKSSLQKINDEIAR